MAFLDEASKNYSYVEINHVRNMKGLGCSNIRTEYFAIRRHGRKWLHFPALGMRAGFPCKSPCKGNSTGQDYWVLGVCARLHMLFPASECLCSSLKGRSQASPFFWVILWHLHHDDFLLLFLNLSCNTYHTAFEFLHVFPLPDTHCPIHLGVLIP